MRPASRAASFVAWRCASSKYAGTVTTAPVSSPPRRFSARSRRAFNTSALTSIGDFGPWTVSTATPPAASTMQ